MSELPLKHDDERLAFLLNHVNPNVAGPYNADLCAEASERIGILLDTRKPINLQWKYKSTNDSEFARARYQCFDVEVHDCDGDMSEWHIKRGAQYLAMGTTYSIVPYHMDAAMKKVEWILPFFVRAVEMNTFINSPEYKAALEANR